MTLTLETLFPDPEPCSCVAEASLAERVAGGYVRGQMHPEGRLRIFNYSEKAAYEGVWDKVTTTCRGLIVDNETGEVRARPFAKFFNYGQNGAPALALDAPVMVTDKMDGSLGITYWDGEGWAIATRGSFVSEQAIHATEVLRTRYPTFQPPTGKTVLFEIVYPANRIVVDYGQLDDLVLLGSVNIETGRTFGPDSVRMWPGPRAAVFPHRTLAEALAAEPRPNAEGLVVHCLTTDNRVKIKQADYVALHRIVTGLSARTVWQHMVDGKPLAELIAPLPDEFGPWVEDVAAQLADDVDYQMSEIRKAHAEVVAQLPPVYSRKEFAALAVPHPLKWALFLVEDCRDPRPELWKRAEPEAFWTPAGRRFTEESA